MLMITTATTTNEDPMNRRHRSAAVAAALLGALALAACEGGVHVGAADGPRATITPDVTAVTAVDIGTSGTMRVAVGDEPSLSITASEDVLDAITVVVHGDTLEIDLPGAWLNPGAIEYELTMPALSAVTIEGSADVDGELAPAGEGVEVRIDGSGDVDLSGATADAVTVEIDGSGDVTLTDLAASTASVVVGGSGQVRLVGTSDRLAVRIPGSGDVDTTELVAQDVTVEIGGSGSADVHAERTLDARIGGSGDIGYLGDPDVTSDVSGSGDVGPA